MFATHAWSRGRRIATKARAKKSINKRSFMSLGSSGRSVKILRQSADGQAACLLASKKHMRWH